MLIYEYIWIYNYHLGAGIATFLNADLTYLSEVVKTFCHPMRISPFLAMVAGNLVLMVLHNFLMWGCRLRDDNSEEISANYLSTSSMPTTSTFYLCENVARNLLKNPQALGCSNWSTEILLLNSFIFILYHGSYYVVKGVFSELHHWVNLI